jgi:hypothetical protein
MALNNNARQQSRSRHPLAFLCLCFALEWVAAYVTRGLLQRVAPPLAQVPTILFCVLVGVHLSLAAFPPLARIPSRGKKTGGLAFDTIDAGDNDRGTVEVARAVTLPDPFSHLPAAEIGWQSLKGDRVIRYPIGRFRFPWSVEQVSVALRDKYGWRPGAPPGRNVGYWTPVLKGYEQQPRGRRARRNHLPPETSEREEEYAIAHSVLMHMSLDSVPRAARGLVGGTDRLTVRMETEEWPGRRTVVAMTSNVNLRSVLHFQELACYEPHPDAPHETQLTSLVEVHAPSWIVHRLVRALGSDTGTLLESHLKQLSARCSELYGPPPPPRAASAQ